MWSMQINFWHPSAFDSGAPSRQTLVPRHGRPSSHSLLLLYVRAGERRKGRCFEPEPVASRRVCGVAASTLTCRPPRGRPADPPVALRPVPTSTRLAPFRVSSAVTSRAREIRGCAYKEWTNNRGPISNFPALSSSSQPSPPLSTRSRSDRALGAYSTP